VKRRDPDLNPQLWKVALGKIPSLSETSAVCGIVRRAAWGSGAGKRVDCLSLDPLVTRASGRTVCLEMLGRAPLGRTYLGRFALGEGRKTIVYGNPKRICLAENSARV
jgi:hypothetical protein